MTIRPARADDLDALLGLYRLFGDDKASAAPPAPAVAAPILAAAIADQARHLVVGELDGEVCATADMVVVANLTHHGQPWAIVENVVVAADRRRRGVGSELMRHLVALAREQGCCKVQLLSGKHRLGAHEMYRGLGFEAVAEGFKLYFDE